LKVNLKIKCSNCGYWNRVPVNKMFLEQPSQDSKVKVFIPVYEPLKTAKCEKCGKIIAEPKTLIIRTHKNTGKFSNY